MENFIPGEQFYYTRIMLFSWSCDSDPTSLSETNAEKFIQSIKNINDDIEFIIINCDGINDIDDHFLNPFVIFFQKTKKTIIFFSCDNKAKLIDYFNRNLDKNDCNNTKTFSEGGTNSFCVNNNEITSADALKIISKAISLEKKWLIKQIKNTYHKHDSEKRLSSTPLKALGEFNATKILSDPKKYKWITMLMAESIIKEIQPDHPKSFTIVAASLRGAIIAGAIWEILYFSLKPSLYIIDHMGPRHALIDIPKDTTKLRVDYCIYIGDFMIGGTELKIVNSFCSFAGGNVKHAFVIGKYFDEENIGNDVKLHSLVNLKDCIDNLKYSLD